MQVIAHRGASQEAPENTLIAFELAINAKADGIELDVMEVDGEFFVFHDRYLDRLVQQNGRLQDLSTPQIRTLRVRGEQPIPTLDEALASIAGRSWVNIELKSINTLANMLRILDQAVSTYGFHPEKLLVSSFNHHWLHALKQWRPAIRIGALSVGCMLEYAQFAEALKAYSLHVDVDFVTPELILDAHQRGLRVYVYTVDEPEDMLMLQDWGVDGIFTNNPRHALSILHP